MTIIPEVITAPASILGECPIWCDRTQRLYWIDSRAPCLHVLEFETGRHRSHRLPEIAGSICLTEDGNLLVAMVSGIYRISSEGLLGALLAAPPGNHPDNRFNDGRCDRAGRFFAGTMNDRQRIPTGTLWRLQSDGDLSAVEHNIIVPNSLAFSPDNDRMYFADTYRHRILAFDYDIEAGAISNKRLFANLEGQPGRPDGSAIDADGCLWNAEYAGGRLTRYRPDGRVDRVIELPVTQPTCCAFGGPDLDCLLITTASQRLSPRQLEEQPLAGRLFMIRPGVRGLPEGRFAG